jgi:hypothetical protein
VNQSVWKESYIIFTFLLGIFQLKKTHNNESYTEVNREEEQS